MKNRNQTRKGSAAVARTAAHNIFLLAAILVPATAWPQGLRLNPATACELLREDGLRTRGGYRANGATYQCRSQRRNLTSGGRLNNSIRFIARGDAQSVNQLTLELEVQSRTAVQRAHRSLAEHTAALFDRALHTEMPQQIESAILSAVAGNWSVAGASVSLQRISLAGPGYQLRLRIE